MEPGVPGVEGTPGQGHTQGGPQGGEEVPGAVPEESLRQGTHRLQFPQPDLRGQGARGLVDDLDQVEKARQVAMVRVQGREVAQRPQGGLGAPLRQGTHQVLFKNQGAVVLEQIQLQGDPPPGPEPRRRLG